MSDHRYYLMRDHDGSVFIAPYTYYNLTTLAAGSYDACLAVARLYGSL